MFMMMMTMNLFMSIMFMFLNHPMSMGLILLIQTIFISMISGFFSLSFWYSYILFLIMIGGMLVLFMYMTSLASNEKFKLSNKMMIYFTLLISMLIISFMIMDQNILSSSFKTCNFNEIFNNMMLFKNENMKSLNLIYNYPNNFITFMLINYLLLTLVMVVKITKSNTGPLRQKF